MSIICACLFVWSKVALPLINPSCQLNFNRSLLRLGDSKCISILVAVYGTSVFHLFTKTTVLSRSKILQQYSPYILVLPKPWSQCTHTHTDEKVYFIILFFCNQNIWYTLLKCQSKMQNVTVNTKQHKHYSQFSKWPNQMHNVLTTYNKMYMDEELLKLECNRN